MYIPPEAVFLKLFSSFGSDFTVQYHYFLKGFASRIPQNRCKMYKKTEFFKFYVSKTRIEIGGGGGARTTAPKSWSISSECSDIILRVVLRFAAKLPTAYM